MAKRKAARRPRRTAAKVRVTNIQYDVIPIEGESILHGVNSSLELAGQAPSSDGAQRAILVTPAGTKILGTLGGSTSSARAVNDAGAVVGGSLTKGDEDFHAFLYEDGVMRDLNDLIPSDAGWQLIQALGINAHGDIIAIGHYDGADHAVLLKRRSSVRRRR